MIAERPRKILTLCLVLKGEQVLLGMKKRGFGAGWWNGFGGKLHEGESLEDAAVREAKEEAGIVVEAMEKAGVMEFEFTGVDEILQVHIFKVTAFSGEPVESEEMRPAWFDRSDIPFAQMWPSDTLWVPLFLSGKKFSGWVLFDEAKAIVKHEVSEVYGF